MRHTRDYWAGRPVPYFVLHRIGFSVPPALPPGAVGSCPTFSPLPCGSESEGEGERVSPLTPPLPSHCDRRAVCFLWHCPSRRLDPPRPGLSGSASGRRPCGQPNRRDSVSRRESCPMVSGLSSPNRRRARVASNRRRTRRGFTRAVGMFPKNGATTWPQDQGWTG